uniref:hypothetical protein n=1 Tax=Paractinoplanes polyasparticus TaxID=2856853 RepID=UPI001C84DDFF|nr:hypothetical protein [Actinoplanes polyasparticus]
MRTLLVCLAAAGLATAVAGALIPVGWMILVGAAAVIVAAGMAALNAPLWRRR